MRYAYLLQENDEAGLLEVPILGQGVAQAQLLHDAETEAVRKRPGLIAVFEEECLDIAETFWIHPFDAAGIRCHHGIEETVDQVAVAARLQECRGFIEDVIRGDEAAPATRTVQQPTGGR